MPSLTGILVPKGRISRRVYIFLVPGLNTKNNLQGMRGETLDFPYESGVISYLP